MQIQNDSLSNNRKVEEEEHDSVQTEADNKKRELFPNLFEGKEPFSLSRSFPSLIRTFVFSRSLTHNFPEANRGFKPRTAGPLILQVVLPLKIASINLFLKLIIFRFYINLFSIWDHHYKRKLQQLVLSLEPDGQAYHYWYNCFFLIIIIIHNS